MIMIAVKLSLQKYIFISALISIILSASYSLRISKNRNSVQSFTTIKKGALTRLWQGGGVERDEEFELMKREIENMMVEKTPAAVVAPTELSSFEKFGRKRSTKQGIAVGSVLAGVVLSSIQSGSQVSGIALLRAMERDSVPIQVRVPYD